MYLKLLKYLSVYLSACLKFILGVILGVTEELSVFEVTLFTFLGSMTTVVLIVVLGNKYRKSLAEVFDRIKSFVFKFFYRVLGSVQILLGKEQNAKELLRNRLQKKQFSKTVRFTIKIWKRFGILGVAILTPLILSPIGGALVAVSFRVETKKTILYMALSHLFFALLFSFVFIEFKEFVENTLGIQLRKKH